MTPKATVKQNKLDAVKMLTDAFESAKSAAFIDYTGMNMSSMGVLRQMLTDSGSKMQISKNTLTKIAIKNAGLPDELTKDKILAGQTAIVFGNEDAVVPIQILGKFAKENELATFKAGVIEGTFQDKASLTKISLLPTKAELQAQTMGAIAAPLYGIVGTLQASMQKLIFVLDAATKGGDYYGRRN